MKKINTLLAALINNLSFILAIAGISFIVYSSFLLSAVLGYLDLGIALILVAYVISPAQEPKGR